MTFDRIAWWDMTPQTTNFVQETWLNLLFETKNWPFQFKQPLICNLFKHYVICVTLKKSLINKVKNWLSGVLSFAGDVWNILLVYSFEESGIMTCLQEGSMNYWMECMTQMSPSRDRYIGVGLYMADQMFCEGLKNLVTGRKCGTRAE